MKEDMKRTNIFNELGIRSLILQILRKGNYRDAK
jgi:hypothetical protein